MIYKIVRIDLNGWRIRKYIVRHVWKFHVNFPIRSRQIHWWPIKIDSLLYYFAIFRSVPVHCFSIIGRNPLSKWKSYFAIYNTQLKTALIQMMLNYACIRIRMSTLIMHKNNLQHFTLVLFDICTFFKRKYDQSRWA